PLLNYLRRHVGMYEMLKGVQERFALDPSTFSDDDKKAIVELAFERYFNDRGLFGTPQSCLAQVKRLLVAGVNEEGCLIEFGVDHAAALDGLPFLAELRDRARQLRSPLAAEPTVPRNPHGRSG